MRYKLEWNDVGIDRKKWGIDLMTFDLAKDNNLFLHFTSGHKRTINVECVKLFVVDDEIIMNKIWELRQESEDNNE